MALGEEALLPITDQVIEPKHVVARAAQPEPQTDAYLVTLKPGLCVNDLRAWGLCDQHRWNKNPWDDSLWDDSLWGCPLQVFW